MIKILFVCLGNICRSPMAEFICRDMLEKRGLSHKIACASAATSDEEAGNPVYPPARRKLKEMGIDCALKRAVQLTRGDYDRYDLLVGMEERNIAAMKRICGGDPDGKLHLLLDYTNRPGELADPWYTDDFQSTWEDVTEGCQGLLKALES